MGDRRRQTCQAKCPWDISLRRRAPCCKQQVQYFGLVIARLADMTCYATQFTGLTAIFSELAKHARPKRMDMELFAVENLMVIRSPNGSTSVGRQDEGALLASVAGLATNNSHWEANSSGNPGYRPRHNVLCSILSGW